MASNTFYIETYGCTSNKADSYIISNVLRDANYKQTSLDEARFIIINTCGVKQQTENKIKTRLRLLSSSFKKDANKHIIITGCLPFIDESYVRVIGEIVPNFSAIIDLDRIHEIAQIINQINKGYKNLVIKSKGSIEKARYLYNFLPGKVTGIVPISEGCLGSCTYCCVKNARGRLNCYHPENIVNNVEHQLKQGIKQIYLTSQDCSNYQYNDTHLSDLVQKIIELDFKFFLRIGMLNPQFLIDNFDQLISIYNFNKVYQFLHIPIQSGSDKILETMSRNYKISKLMEKINLLRERFPSLTISTDIICGFPGERDNDFKDTIEFIKWLRPEILNISKFTPRPGTKAKFMEQVNSKIIKERTIKLSRIFRENLININKDWINWEGEVLILHSTAKENQVFSRNFAYKNIFINNYEGILGNFSKVRVYEVDGFNLYANLIDIEYIENEINSNRK
ncbi:MAG: tRNA (N(6)-L-threonylcarbamoyladenosine(37)-C(2))-methylthiotransferase [Promethearchaeota archaeon]